MDVGAIGSIGHVAKFGDLACTAVSKIASQTLARFQLDSAAPRQVSAAAAVLRRPFNPPRPSVKSAPAAGGAERGAAAQTRQGLSAQNPNMNSFLKFAKCSKKA